MAGAFAAAAALFGVAGVRGLLAGRAGAVRLPPVNLVLAKTACAALASLAAFAAAPAAPGRVSWLVAVGMPVAGFFVPDALRERKERLRHRRLIGALPDAFDLLAVGAVSGRSAATGLVELAATGEGPFAAELQVTIAELSCGRPLGSALRALRARVPGHEVARLCAAIERSRRFGSPLAEQLRRQSNSLRDDQRRAVEERAARAAPKIQLVVALVLVPSVLLMIVAALLANADLLLSGF